jgi:hypothetical protein
LDASLEPARRTLSSGAGGAAWKKGNAMAIEKAIEEVLTIEPAESSGSSSGAD